MLRFVWGIPQFQVRGYRNRPESITWYHWTCYGLLSQEPNSVDSGVWITRTSRRSCSKTFSQRLCGCFVEEDVRYRRSSSDNLWNDIWNREKELLLRIATLFEVGRAISRPARILGRILERIQAFSMRSCFVWLLYGQDNVCTQVFVSRWYHNIQ